MMVQSQNETQSLSTSQTRVLRSVLNQISRLRANKEGYFIPKPRHYSGVYCRFKNFFSLTKYSDLPESKYKEGLAFLNRWLMKEEKRGELI